MRIEGDICETCQFWFQTEIGMRLGLCRRKPPEIVVHAESMVTHDIYQATSFPATARDEWCGEHERK